MNATKLHLLFFALALCATRPVDADAPVVQIEKSAGVNGPWQSVPANDLPTTPEGGLLDPTSNPAGFYRLRIIKTDWAGGPTALALNEVPKEALDIALQHLQSSPEEGWANAALGPIVYPVYNPAINGGKEPAYLEFKVIPGVPAGRPTVLFKSPPLDNSPDLGFILVSLTREDVPIPEFGTEGPTQVEKLRRLAKSSFVRAVRYSDAILVAENERGEALANLGATPFQLPATVLDYAGKTLASEVVDGKFITRPPLPTFTGTPYPSFRAFRDDYLQSKTFIGLRTRRAQAAKVAWDLRADKAPALIEIDLKVATQILTNSVISSFELENPTIASLQVVAKVNGLNAVGLVAGSSLLQVFYPDNTTQFFILQVGPPLKGAFAAGWGSWHTYYAGSWSDQKHYGQEWDLSGCCSDGWSGCGATAWAMFYGYWDAKGVTSLIGGTSGTPLHNDSYVRDCIQHIFGYVSTYCVGDQGATNPWDMDEGHQWATHQGAHISISTEWGVPYVSSGPRNKAIHAIKDHGRPAIVGTGFYEHYPFAYGYKYRTYTFWGVTWDTERYWKVNNGHADNSGIWVNASSCWFGADGYCY